MPPETQRQALDKLRSASATAGSTGQMPSDIVRILAAGTAISPPALGVALILVVVLDVGPSPITRSAAVAISALVVGAALILGSGMLYCRTPGNFLDFAKTFSGHKSSASQSAAATNDNG